MVIHWSRFREDGARFTLQPLRQLLRLFSAQLSANQNTKPSRRSGRPDNVMGQSIVLNAIKTDFFRKMMIQLIRISNYNNMESELRSFEIQIDFANFVWMQDI